MNPRNTASAALAAVLALAACGEDRDPAPAPAPAAAETEPAAVEPAGTEDPPAEPEPPADGAPETAPDPPPPVDPVAEARALWRERIETGALSEEREATLLAIVQSEILPPIHDAQWQVEPVWASGVSDVHAELVAPVGVLAELELRHRGSVDEAQREAFGEHSYQGHPVTARGRFYFVLVGDLELRFTGHYPAFQQPEGLQKLFEKFSLETLTAL